MPAEAAAAAAPAAAPATPSPAGTPPPAVSPAPASAPAAAQAPSVAPSAAAPAAAEPAKPAAPEAAPVIRRPSLLQAAEISDAEPTAETPATEEKPEGEKAATTEYKDFALPEGVEADPAVLEKAKPLFAELGLNQDQAQKLVTFQAELVKEQQAALKEAALAPYKEWSEQQAKWQKEVMDDKEIGGRNFAATNNAIMSAVNKIMSTEQAAEFYAALSHTGAGDNLHILKALYKLAKPYSEGKGVTGNIVPMTPPKSLAGRLYPTTAKQE